MHVEPFVVTHSLLFQLMGSRISRPSTDSSPIAGPPHLPFDIYLEVLSHLGTSSAEDRQTLLAVALCCRALRGASQRNLFSSIHCDNPASDTPNLALKVHSKFLRAVGDSPDRLALYVLSYSQHELALDPKLRSTGMALLIFYPCTLIKVTSQSGRSGPQER